MSSLFIPVPKQAALLLEEAEMPSDLDQGLEGSANLSWDDSSALCRGIQEASVNIYLLPCPHSLALH